MAKGPPPAFQALTISLAVSIRFSLAEEVFLRPHSTPGHFPDSSQLPKLYSSPPTLPDSRGEERHGLMLVRFLFPRLYVLAVMMAQCGEAMFYYKVSSFKRRGLPSPRDHRHSRAEGTMKCGYCRG